VICRPFVVWNWKKRTELCIYVREQGPEMCLSSFSDNNTMREQLLFTSQLRTVDFDTDEEKSW
jgi:hypothetical protein